jgi:hypothetical protein
MTRGFAAGGAPGRQLAASTRGADREKMKPPSSSSGNGRTRDGSEDNRGGGGDLDVVGGRVTGRSVTAQRDRDGSGKRLPASGVPVTW